MKNLLFSRITRLGWIWICILYVCSVVFYSEFFDWLLSFFLGAFITVILVGMLLVGYLHLGPRRKFPLGLFTIWVVLFSVGRYSYIYFFLHHYMPEYTVFHYIDRVIPTVIFSSASLLFLGYSYAIYEWGLAAREKYKNEANQLKKDFDQPIIIRADAANIYLLPQDIHYISANGEYVDYHTVTKKYTVFKRLKAVEKELKPLGFFRCHRSYIINLKYLKAVGTKSITIGEDIEIPLSKTYGEGLKQGNSEYLRNKKEAK